MPLHYSPHVRIQRGGQGSGPPLPPPLKNHKFIGFPSNTGPDPLKITKLPSRHSTVGQYQPASETPFQWRFVCRPIIGHFWWSLEPRSPKKSFYQSWIPSDKTFWIRAWSSKLPASPQSSDGIKQNRKTKIYM